MSINVFTLDTCTECIHHNTRDCLPPTAQLHENENENDKYLHRLMKYYPPPKKKKKKKKEKKKTGKRKKGLIFLPPSCCIVNNSASLSTKLCAIRPSTELFTPTVTQTIFWRTYSSLSWIASFCSEPYAKITRSQTWNCTEKKTWAQHCIILHHSFPKVRSWGVSQ